MSFPTIEELRSQCRIDNENEDNLLQIYLKAAIKNAENRLNLTLHNETVPENDSEGIVVNDDIKLALMFAVSHWYDYRDSSKIPAGFYELIDPYRVIPI